MDSAKLKLGRDAVEWGRNGYGDLSTCTSCIEQALASGATHADLGTTAKEVSGFERQFKLKAGEDAVRWARNGYGDLRFCMSLINTALEADISYQQLGTSKAEIAGFPRAFKLKAAKDALKSLRSESNDHRPFKWDLEQALAVGISYEELGTTQSEVLALLRHFIISAARRTMELLRAKQIGSHAARAQIERTLAAGLPYANFGTTEEEFLALIA